ncbi:MAG: peptidoglycan-binding protein [Gaiellaceae bacterium]
MRHPRLVIVAALAAGLTAAVPAGALNPQSAGLQVALRFQGLYAGPIDGLAGAGTVHAVRAFQRRQGLRPTGLADVRTRAALGPLGRPLFGSRQLLNGMLGWDVAVLQFLIARQGIAVPVTGYFDRPTAAALRVYQRRLRLRADAVAGPATFAALGLQTHVPVPTVQLVASKLYIVRAGDSLAAIARRHLTTVAVLARLNRLNPAKLILIGARLQLPAPRSRRAAAPVSVATDAAVVRASLGRWASHFGIDPSLARALAWMESGYQQRVVSSVGAMGVMQLLPSTWNYVETVLIGHPVDHSADGNVEAGLAYLDHLLKAFGGNEKLALAAWYQGEAAVRADGLYPETRTFVANVLALRSRM